MAKWEPKTAVVVRGLTHAWNQRSERCGRGRGREGVIRISNDEGSSYDRMMTFSVWLFLSLQRSHKKIEDKKKKINNRKTVLDKPAKKHCHGTKTGTCVTGLLTVESTRPMGILSSNQQ